MNPFYVSTSHSQVHTLANNVYPDEMLHTVAFHQGIHCLLRQKGCSEKEIQYFFYTKFNL